MQIKLKDVPSEERPLERCLKLGPSALSLRECLALILGTGTRETSCLQIAERILERLYGAHDLPEATRSIALSHSIQSLMPGDFSGIPGIGPMKQAKLLATFEIAKRHAIAYEITRELAQRTSQASSSLSASSRSNPSLKAVPDDTTKVLTQALQRVSPELRSASREWIGFVPVYRNQVGELCLIDWGTRTHVNTDPAALFQRLLALKPDGFVLFHNHPSRELTPSQADYVLTEEVRSLAEVFKIRLLNHGIVTSLKTRWIL